MEVLGCTEVAEGDNFFLLGGTSMMAARLQERVWQLLGIRPTLRDLLRCRTFAEQAGLVAGAADGGELVVPPAGELAFHSQLAARFDRARAALSRGDLPAINAMTLTMRFRKVSDLEVVAGAVGDLLRRHDGLRTAYVFDGPVVRAEVRELEPGWRPVVRDYRERGRGAALRAVAEEMEAAERGVIDLGAGPVALVLVAGVADGEAVGGLVLDHVCADGQSMLVLRRDLEELYAARVTGRPPRLPRLVAPEYQLVAWNAQRAEVDVERRSAAWRELMASYPQAPVFELMPHDRPAYEFDVAPAACAEYRLDGGAVAGLVAGARALGVPALAVVLAALYLGVHAVSGASDICVRVHHQRRDVPGSQDAVGWFSDEAIVRVGDVFGGHPGRAGWPAVARHVAAYIDRAAEIMLPVTLVMSALGLDGTHLSQIPHISLDYAEPGLAMLPADPLTIPIPPPAPSSEGTKGIRVVVRRGTDALTASFIAPEPLYSAPVLEELAGHMKNALTSLMKDQSTLHC